MDYFELIKNKKFKELGYTKEMEKDMLESINKNTEAWERIIELLEKNKDIINGYILKHMIATFLLSNSKDEKLEHIKNFLKLKRKIETRGTTVIVWKD